MAKFKFQDLEILIDEKTRDSLLEDLDHLCRNISNFKKKLRID